MHFDVLSFPFLSHNDKSLNLNLIKSLFNEMTRVMYKYLNASSKGKYFTKKKSDENLKRATDKRFQTQLKHFNCMPTNFFSLSRFTQKK